MPKIQRRQKITLVEHSQLFAQASSVTTAAERDTSKSTAGRLGEELMIHLSGQTSSARVSPSRLVDLRVRVESPMPTLDSKPVRERKRESQFTFFDALITQTEKVKVEHELLEFKPH